MTFVGGDSDHQTLFYFNIKELFKVFCCGDALRGLKRGRKGYMKTLMQGFLALGHQSVLSSQSVMPCCKGICPTFFLLSQFWCAYFSSF